MNSTLRCEIPLFVDFVCTPNADWEPCNRMGKFLLVALIFKTTFFQWSTAVVQNATQFQHESGSVSELQPLPCCLYLRRSSSVCSSASLLRTCCLSEQWVYTLWHLCTTSSMHVPCYPRFVFPQSSCDHQIWYVTHIFCWGTNCFLLS